MAIYRARPLSREQIRKQKLAAAQILMLTLALSLIICFYGGRYEAALPELRMALFAFLPFFALVLAFCATVLLNSKSMGRWREDIEYEISPLGVSSFRAGMDGSTSLALNLTQTLDAAQRQSRSGSNFLLAETICSFESQTNGTLLLRAKPWPRRLAVPRCLSDLEGFRRELLEMGIPEIRVSGLKIFGRRCGLLSMLLLVVFCCGYMFMGKNLYGVILATAVYVLMMLTTYAMARRSSDDRFRSLCLPRTATMSLLLLLVAFRVWTLSHPHPEQRNVRSEPCSVSSK